MSDLKSQFSDRSSDHSVSEGKSSLQCRKTVKRSIFSCKHSAESMILSSSAHTTQKHQPSVQTECFRAGFASFNVRLNICNICTSAACSGHSMACRSITPGRISQNLCICQCENCPTDSWEMPSFALQ